MNRFENMSSYSPVGDLLVVSICLVMIVLMTYSYISRSRNYRIFISLITFTIFAAITNVSYHMLAQTQSPDLVAWVLVLRCTHHTFLYLTLLHFVLYIGIATQLSQKEKRPFLIVASATFIAVIMADIIDTVRDISALLSNEALALQGHDLFVFGYCAFIAIIIVLLARVRRRLYRQVMMGFYGTMAISFAIMVMQALFRQSSFTVGTFLFPIVSMLYIMHSNPYDALLGAVDSRALEDYVRYHYETGKPFGFISLYLRDFDEEGKAMPEELQAEIRRFATDFFRGATLFQVGRGHQVLLFRESRNRDYDQRMSQTLMAFRDEYRRFQFDYKLVIGHSIDEVSRKNEYVSFIRGIHRDMEENTVYKVGPEDVKKFEQLEYVRRELEDIYRKLDLDDPRVLTYCQPVYNIHTGRYDTAEALMRLELKDAGMVYPNIFIPLAEENGYIHALTEIMLNKTCKAVRRLSEAGYRFSRISVNVSALELKDDHFCQDITRIIDRSGIDGDSIAIELTESKSDSDFLLAKEKISELRKRGIKFYLDDFGTGYSNMERIMELPFDIIKFDRSLVIACGLSERSKKIVLSLANMLSELNYSVLFEGVESESDERMCEDMSASYLQGYRYSRPVPIESLESFFERGAA